MLFAILGLMGLAAIVAAVEDDDDAIVEDIGTEMEGLDPNTDLLMDAVDGPAVDPTDDLVEDPALVNEPPDQRVVISGDEDRNFIEGTDLSETILAGGDVDFADAKGGDDRVRGGDNSDFLTGGDGDDIIFGETGFDLILGQDGDDRLRGGDGRDALVGGRGSDELFGDNDGDVIVSAEFFNETGLTPTEEEIAAFVEDPNVSFSPIFQRLIYSEVDPAPDKIDGGRGDDIFILGSGDIVAGGEGADRFDFGDWIDPDNPTIITDFDPQEDRLLFVHEPRDDGSLPQMSFSTLDDGSFEVRADGVRAAIVSGDDILNNEPGVLLTVVPYNSALGTP